jgi:hydroxymethylpyrimidine/phosphomethylpyrimidine kinase
VRLYTALSVAGSDPGGGAGIQADLKTFRDRGVYGMAAITALTVQNTRGVQQVEAVEGRLVAAQVSAVLDDLPVGAIKIGMVPGEDVIHALCQVLECRPAGIPLVIDPVMLAKDGTALLPPSALRLYVERLLPLATLVTPNLPERAALDALGWRPTGAVLTKGGHASGDRVVDELSVDGQLHRFRHRRIRSVHTHGTGCTLSAAIAAELSRGVPLPEAVRRSIRYVSRLIREAQPGLGGGQGPLWHGLRARPGPPTTGNADD